MVSISLDDDFDDPELNFQKKVFAWMCPEDFEGIDGPDLDHCFLFTKQFPIETEFFKKFWINDASEQGFYTRSAYFDRWNEDGRRRPKWRASKFYRNNQSFFIRFDEAQRRRQIYKHLGWQNYLQVRKRRFHKPLINLETAHWLGTLPGPTTRSDAIDLDSHTVVGFYTLPAQYGTRRELPVPKCDIAFFQLMKRLHDAFPDRIWMTSSANLGKGLWQLHPESVPTSQVEDEVERSLKSNGLALEHYPVMPKSRTSFGKCHRRPFGLDSALHTEEGLIVTPLRQIRYLMSYDARISWPTLFKQHIDQMRSAYDLWEHESRQPSIFANEAIDESFRDRPKADVLKELRDDIETALDWFISGSLCAESTVSVCEYEERDQRAELDEQYTEFDYGKVIDYRGKPHVIVSREQMAAFPTSLKLKVDQHNGMLLLEQKWLEQPVEIISAPSTPETPALAISSISNSSDSPAMIEKSLEQIQWDEFEHSESIKEIKLKKKKEQNQQLWDAFENGETSEGISINFEPSIPFSDAATESNSNFWTYLKSLAQNGVPEPDRLHEYLLDLAAPLFWRDHFSVPEDQRVQIIFDDLLFWVQHKHNGHVSRLGTSSGLADIDRQILKQIQTVSRCGEALKNYYARMRENDQRYPHRIESLSEILRGRKEEKNNQPPSHCKCMGVDSEKEPVSDEEKKDVPPLPKEIENRLLEIVEAHPKLRSKGKCVFLDFARRFLSRLWEGKGKAHLNWKKLNEFRGKPKSKDRNQVWSYKDLLAEAGLIHSDWIKHARRGTSSSRYHLTAKAMKAFAESPAHSQPSPNRTACALSHAEAKDD